MADVIRLLRANESQMFEQAQEDFAGATALMEWMVRSFDLPLRKAKMVLERAVKYSEKERGKKVSYQSLKKALLGMKINVPIRKQDVERVQRPERILTQTSSIGTPSEKRMKGQIISLRERVKAHRNWLAYQRRRMDKTRRVVEKMEKEIVS